MREMGASGRLAQASKDACRGREAFSENTRSRVSVDIVGKPTQKVVHLNLELETDLRIYSCTVQ